MLSWGSGNTHPFPPAAPSSNTGNDPSNSASPPPRTATNVPNAGSATPSPADRANSAAMSTRPRQGGGKRSLRMMRLEEMMQRPNASTLGLQELLWLGIVGEDADEAKLRGPVWRVLLGYLPLARDNRIAEAARKRKEYVETQAQYLAAEGELPPHSPHQKTLKQIRADVHRTTPEGFRPLFRHPRVQQLMERALLVWSIRNPASGYVQGINDLLTPFLVVFVSEACGTLTPTAEDLDRLSKVQLMELEADVSWCLSRVLSHVQDNFVFGQPGIVRMTTRMREIVQRVDQALCSHLESQQVDLFQICFRWMNCFLLRELPLPAVIRLWDTYIAEGSEGFSDFHVYVCAVFLVHWSSHLKTLDFQHIILFLQKLPTSNWGSSEVESLVAEAFVLKSLFHSSPKHLERSD